MVKSKIPKSQLPLGEYKMEITNVIEVQGEIEMTMRITNGPYEGRIIKTRMKMRGRR